ncbi:glycosyl transferase family 2, partial [Candidatus Bathyarchaeota archaeon]
MANPLISVTIPTKNSEETISFCLQSIREQSYPDIEIVVVDGFSSDKTRMIAESYGAKIVLCKGGLLEARFLGVENSRGEYVVLVDSDQILEKTAIERA